MFNKFIDRINHLSWIISSTIRFYLVLIPFGHLRPIIPRAGGGYKLHKSNLGADGRLLYLVHDKVIAPFVNKFGYWDIETSNFISKHLNTSNSKQIFIDIGANQGLISLQVYNNLHNLNKIQFICVEPSLLFFNNLKKNVKELNAVSNFTLLNFGLGNLSKQSTPIFISKRNATSTQNLNLSLDSREDLIEERVEIVSVLDFVKTYLEPVSYDFITVKSDTDGSDIAIFDCLINSPISFKITCYVLEVILTDLTKTERELLIRNCNNFSQWIFVDRDNNYSQSKNTIINFLKSKQGYIGDLFLTNKFTNSKNSD
jgi:FkbM family methyltransferase